MLRNRVASRGRPSSCSGAFAADAASKLDILGKDSHTLGVDGTKVGVLEETGEVRLRSLLERHYGVRLEAQISLEVLRDLADETLEGELTHEKLGRLLISSDFTQRDSSRPEAMGLLHATGRRRGLARGLGGDRLARGL